MSVFGFEQLESQDTSISLTNRFWGVFLSRVKEVFSGLRLVFQTVSLNSAEMLPDILGPLKQTLEAQPA